MTFVELPTFSDIISNSTGAGAWANPAFLEFLPMAWWAVGSMGAAIILLWIFAHLSNITNWIQSRLFGAESPKQTTGSSNFSRLSGNGRSGKIIVKNSKINLFQNRIIR